MTMFDRVRSRLKRQSKVLEQPNGAAPVANGVHETNGTSASYTNGASSASSPINKRGTGYVPVKSDGEASGSYPEPPDHTDAKIDLEAMFSSFAGLISHSMRPLPEQTGDGTYLEDDIHPSFWKDLSTIGIKDMETLVDQIKAGKGPIDDKTMLMERVIQLVAGLPDRSLRRSQLSNTFVDQLFNSLQHPPMSYLSDEFRYRKADGSFNNHLYPKLGAANTPYARTVQPETIQTGALPDPGLIFDSLFARESFRPHPNRNSSIIFYWASIIIHDLFQTDHEDFSNSKTSSYLDLSPLYGDNQDDQDQIRTFKDGKLKPDCFAEERLLTFPAGCGVILIMFNRFHNFVAEQLAAINQGGRFTRPADNASKEAWAKHDNDLFQTARLVTGGLYMNITLIDYVHTIVNLNRSNTTWTLDPRVKESDTLFNAEGTPRGLGNQVSAEFNLVYRWHSAISEKDDLWMQSTFKQMFGKPVEEVSMPEMLAGLHQWELSMPKDPHERNFHGLKREPDGKFSDDELVEIITQSIEDCAGAFGANHVPKAMKSLEILGMRQARSWDLCSLNEFRKFFGLKTHRTFEDINPNPKVAEQFRNLYEHPDRVELYPGLVAESEKMPMTEEEGGPVGVGISPTYTVSRAILSDAVALVRGDRFYTIDYNPKNLTNWGYSEVQYNMSVEQGCTFGKLFLRAFPNHFKPNSIYARQPMTIPSENRKIMKNLGRESHYSWDRPGRMPGRIVIQNYKGIMQVLDNQAAFTSVCGPACEYLMGPGGLDFMLSGDTPFHHQQREDMSKSLYFEQWHKQIRDFYEQITSQLIREKSCKVGGANKVNQIDITRDVGNLAHIHFAAEVFSLPLKTEDNPRGIYSEHELYLVMAAMFIFIFFDVDPVKTFELALGARQVTQQLGKMVEAEVSFLSNTSMISGFTDKLFQRKGPLREWGVHMIRRLLESGKSAHEITWSQIVPVAGAMVANQAYVFTQIMEFYIAGAGKIHWEEIARIAKTNPPDADDLLLRYVMEGIRLNGTFAASRKAEKSMTLDDSGFGGQVNVKPGDKIFVSFIKASRDPEVFPAPDDIKLDRPMENYIHYGMGPHQCLGMQASRIALTAMLKTVAKLNNLRPAPGPQGQLKKIPRDAGFYAYMTEDQGKYFPFPTTWKLHFDGEV